MTWAPVSVRTVISRVAVMNTVIAPSLAPFRPGRG
jgi:hypothetical protein